MPARPNEFYHRENPTRLFCKHPTSSPRTTTIQRIPKSMSAAPVVQRIIPGAPPSIELSKSQKKKRKAAKGDDTQSPVVAESASSDKGQGHAETHESAPGLISRAESQAPQLAEDDQLLKPSPIVDLMNKRLKAMTKKIASASPFPTNSDILIFFGLSHRQGYPPMRPQMLKNSMMIKFALSRIYQLWRLFKRSLQK